MNTISNTISGLKDLKKQLDDATHEGYLALTPTLSGAAGLASFLSGLPTQQINLSQTRTTLDDNVTLLSVDGCMNEDWSLRGLEPAGIHMSRLNLEYRDGKEGITVSVKAYGNLSIGTAAIEMTGSLDKNNLLIFALKDHAGMPLSLSGIANFISNNKLSSYLPTGIELFDQVPLTALDFSFGFNRESITEFNFTSDLKKTWTIIPGVATFGEVGVTLSSWYGYRKGYGFQSTIGGNIHGTLNIPKLKQDIKASLALQGLGYWEIQLLPKKGDILPGLTVVADLLGGESLVELVANGLQQLGIKEISLDGVTLGIDIYGKKLLNSTMSGHVTFSDFTFGVRVFLPDFAFHGYLLPGNPIKLKALAAKYFGGADILPEVNIDRLGISAQPGAGCYSLEAAIFSNWQITVAGLLLEFKEFHFQIAREASKVITGAIGGVVSVCKFDIFLNASFKDNLCIDGYIPRLNLTEIAKSFLGGIALPAELPEVELTGVGVCITPRTGEFSLGGKAKIQCTFGNTKLTARLDFDLSRTTALNDETGNKFPVACTIALAVEGPLKIIDELTIKNFTLNFSLLQDGTWSVSGGIDALLFQENFSLKAGYKNGKLMLYITDNRTLLSLEGIAALKVTEVGLELEREKKKIKWAVCTAGELLVGGVHSFAGKIRLYSGDKDAGLILNLEKSSLSIPLVPPGISLDISSGDIVIARNGKTWSFEASSKLKLTGLPPFLYENKILPPDPVAVTFKVDQQSARLTIDRVTGPIDFTMPDLKMPNGTVIEMGELKKFGTARVEVTNVVLSLGKAVTLTAVLGVGLPADLNKIFGVKGDGTPVIEIFNTLPQMIRFEFGIGYLPRQGKFGIIFTMASSPFRKIEIKDKVWKCNLGPFGAVDIDIPTFTLDAGSFSAHVGFKVVEELKIPLQPVKEMLKKAGSGGIEKFIPDAVPLKALNVIDENRKIRVEELITYLDGLLKVFGAAPLPDEIKGVLRKVAGYAGRLPDGFLEYLRINPPDSFNMDISVNTAAGINIDIRVDEKTPLRMLFPGISGGLIPIPVIQGITLRGFSFGTLMGGLLYSMKVDADFDQFDMVSLLAGIALPEAGILPPAKNFHFRMLVKNFSMLIVFVYGVPIPVPLFYDRLGIEYLGIEGVKFQSHVNFPQPSFNLQELIKLLVALKKFFTESTKHLDEQDIPEHMDLQFWMDNCYIKMPDYLGGKLLGKEGPFPNPPIKALDIIAALLNSIKFMSLDDLIHVVPFDYRVGSADINFICLDMKADWLISTPEEFRKGAYSRIRIPAEQVDAYLKLLAGEGKQRGVAVFLKGLWKIEGIAGLDTAFGLIIAGANGFSTQFKIEGFIRDVIYARLSGAIDLVLSKSPDEQSKFQLKGDSYFRFLDIDIFKGDILVQAERDRFHLSGQFQLLPKGFIINASGMINGTFTKQGVSLEGYISANLGIVVLAGVQAVINNTGAWIKATWLLASVEFLLKDNGNRYLVDFSVNIGIASLSARFDLNKQTRAVSITISGTILNLYGLQIENLDREPKSLNTLSTLSCGGLVSLPLQPNEAEAGSDGKLTVTNLGLEIVNGTSKSTNEQITFSGQFHLLPLGAPINVTGDANGWIKPGNFFLFGAVNTTLGPVILTNATATFTDRGLQITGTWLNISITLIFQKNDKWLETSFQLPGVIGLAVKLGIVEDGLEGYAKLSVVIGGLVLDARFALPQVSAAYSLTFFNIPLLTGTITSSATAFSITGDLLLSLPPFLELKAKMTGSIDSQNLLFKGDGQTTSWIPLFPWADAHIKLLNDSLTAALVLHFGGFIGDIGAASSFRWWRGQPCFMVAWKIYFFGLDYNYLAVGQSGIVEFGLVQANYPGDWPPDLRQTMLGEQVQQDMQSAVDFNSIEPMPLFELVQMFLFANWAYREPQDPFDNPFDTDTYLRVMPTCADYGLQLQVLPEKDALEGEYVRRVMINNIGGASEFFLTLKEEWVNWLCSKRQVDKTEIERSINMEKARAIFETTPGTAADNKVTLYVEFRHQKKWQRLSVEFNFEQPLSAYHRLAELLLN